MPTEKIKEVARALRWPEVVSVLSAASSLFLFIFIFGVWKGKVDAHIEDKGVHMPFAQKLETFVPRAELQKDAEAVKALKEDVRAMGVRMDIKLDALQDDISEINKYIREQN
jgi:hypothetical protein